MAMKQRRRLVPAAILLAAGVAAAVGGWVVNRAAEPAPILTENPHRAGTPAHDAFAAYQTTLLANPAFVGMMASAATPEEGLRRGMDLTQKGVRRLSDAALEERLRMMLELMRTGDDAECATLAQGAPLDGDARHFTAVMFALLDRVDADLAKRWYDLTLDATLAELEQQPISPIPAGYQQRLGALMVEGLPRDDLDVLIAMSEQRVFGLADAARCGVGRKVLALILDQPQPERGHYARLMAEP
jgi:hypothetical protein